VIIAILHPDQLFDRVDLEPTARVVADFRSDEL